MTSSRKRRYYIKDGDLYASKDNWMAWVPDRKDAIKFLSRKDAMAYVRAIRGGAPLATDPGANARVISTSKRKGDGA